MEENEILAQANKDWEQLKLLYNKNRTLKYGIVKGFVIDGVLQEYISVNFGNGQSIVFNSIDSIKE